LSQEFDATISKSFLETLNKKTLRADVTVDRHHFLMVLVELQLKQLETSNGLFI
jgi:hypothetical protein